MTCIINNSNNSNNHNNRWAGWINQNIVFQLHLLQQTKIVVLLNQDPFLIFISKTSKWAHFSVKLASWMNSKSIKLIWALRDRIERMIALYDAQKRTSPEWTCTRSKWILARININNINKKKWKKKKIKGGEEYNVKIWRKVRKLNFFHDNLFPLRAWKIDYSYKIRNIT